MRLEDEADPTAAESGDFLLRKGQDVGPVYRKRSAVGAQERAENLQEGRLAGAGCAHDGDDLPGSDFEVEPPQNLQGAETFRDGFRGNDHRLGKTLKMMYFCGPQSGCGAVG